MRGFCPVQMSSKLGALYAASTVFEPPVTQVVEGSWTYFNFVSK